MTDLFEISVLCIGVVIAAALVYLCLKLRERTRLLRAAAQAPSREAQAEVRQALKQQADRAIAEDARLSGFWVKPDEMFEGFPIGAEDIVLDVGCGNGKLLADCAQLASKVIATDINPDSLKRVVERLEKANANFTAFVGDATHLPLPDASASRVIMSEVLEHVDDPGAVMAELVRVGKPGALYYLSVPDPASEILLKQVAAPEAFLKPNHIRVIERDEFAALVEGAGLVMERRAYRGFLSTMYWLLLWLDEPKATNPVIRDWRLLWGRMLALRQGPQLKLMLDDAVAKSQIIIARKPA